MSRSGAKYETKRNDAMALVVDHVPDKSDVEPPACVREIGDGAGVLYGRGHFKVEPYGRGHNKVEAVKHPFVILKGCLSDDLVDYLQGAQSSTSSVAELRKGKEIWHSRKDETYHQEEDANYQAWAGIRVKLTGLPEDDPLKDKAGTAVRVYGQSSTMVVELDETNSSGQRQRVRVKCRAHKQGQWKGSGRNGNWQVASDVPARAPAKSGNTTKRGKSKPKAAVPDQDAIGNFSEIWSSAAPVSERTNFERCLHTRTDHTDRECKFKAPRTSAERTLPPGDREVMAFSLAFRSKNERTLNEIYRRWRCTADGKFRTEHMKGDLEKDSFALGGLQVMDSTQHRLDMTLAHSDNWCPLTDPMTD